MEDWATAEFMDPVVSFSYHFTAFCLGYAAGAGALKISNMGCQFYTISSQTRGI